MNHVERFRAVMAFQAVDRLPRWEWAMWWDQTIDRWHGEGLPRELRFSQVFDIARYFGLDPYQQFWFSTTDATIEATQHHVEGMVSNMDDYLRIRSCFRNMIRPFEACPRGRCGRGGARPWCGARWRGSSGFPVRCKYYLIISAYTTRSCTAARRKRLPAPPWFISLLAP